MATEYTRKSPVVRTNHGFVKGALLTTLYDELYYAFDGIPYAKPPVGELRFRAPQDLEPWTGIRDCTQLMDKCLQVGSLSKQVEGSEDCLYLNIAAKKLDGDKPLPVMVYVHGGVFIRGDPTRRAWAPDYLMQEQVIYISIGYRTGPLGLLSFADPALDIPGNAGIKDIVLALKWIRANVINFNGDSNNITLFGHSSGSMLVHLLMVSPNAERLFDKAILMAGFMPELNRIPDVEYRLAKHLGYEGDNNDAQVFEFINNVDPKLVVSANFLTEEERHASFLTPFIPCVERYVTPGALILAEPRELQRSAWSNQIPLMLGTTSGEGMSAVTFMKKDPKILQSYQQHPEYLLPRHLQLHCDAEKCRQLGEALVQQFCHVASNELTNEHYRPISKIMGYNMFHPQHRLINARLAYGKADNYLYRFDFDSPDFNFYRIRFDGPNSRGAGHVDELGYLFRIPATFKLDKSRAEYKTICRMAAMFVEFALRSNPNAPITQSLVNWKPVTRLGPRMCLNINVELKFIAQPELKKLEFFDDMYEQAAMDLI